MPRSVIFALVLLASMSALLLVLVPRWVPLPQDVLRDAGFATLADDGEPSPWQLVGSGTIERLSDGVRLVNTDPGGTVGIDQVLARPAGAQAFRITATVTLEGVVNGAERWQRPRILVQSKSPDFRPFFHGPYQLVEEDGSWGPVRLSADFPVSASHDDAWLMIRLQRATGVLEVRDLAVVPLEKPFAWVLLRYGLIGVWLVVGAGLAAYSWWRSADRLAASFVIGTLGLITAIVAFPDELRQPLHMLLLDLAGDSRVLLVKPFLHVLGFAALAFAARRALPGWPAWLMVGGWLLAAALLELAEFRYGRFEPDDLGDMALNAAGAMLGLYAARLKNGKGARAALAARDDPGGFRRRP